MTTPNIPANIVNALTNSTLLFGGQGSNAIPMLLVNLDTANTVWIANSSNVIYGQSPGVPLTAGSSMAINGSVSWYGVSNGPPIKVAIIPYGTSYFLPASLINIGGSKIYVQAGAPTGTIPLNSIWFNTTLNALEFWNGTAWVVQAFAGTELIQAGTIVANLIAAGTIIAGIVDGTTINAATFTGGTFEGTDFIINTSGLFFYNGTPASGNDPFFVIAADGTTSDPFGNGVAAGVSVFDQVAGLTVQLYNGTINFNYIFGTFKTITANGEFEYGGSGGALGNLIASDTSVAGTDQYGNAYLAGRTSYANVSGTYIATNLNNGMISLYTASAAGGPYTVQAQLSLITAGGVTAIESDVPIEFTNYTGVVPTNVSTILSNSSGVMQAVNESDGGRYSITHITQYATGQTLGATTPVAISGLSRVLGPGNYEVKVRIYGTCPVAAGSHSFTFVFSGTATGTVNAILWQPQADNAAPTQSTLMNSPLTTSLTSPPQFNTGAWAEIDAIINVTATGTLSMTGQVSIAADTYVINAGSYWKISPA